MISDRNSPSVSAQVAATFRGRAAAAISAIVSATSSGAFGAMTLEATATSWSTSGRGRRGRARGISSVSPRVGRTALLRSGSTRVASRPAVSAAGRASATGSRSARSVSSSARSAALRSSSTGSASCAGVARSGSGSGSLVVPFVRACPQRTSSMSATDPRTWTSISASPAGSVGDGELGRVTVRTDDASVALISPAACAARRGLRAATRDRARRPSGRPGRHPGRSRRRVRRSGRGSSPWPWP